MFMKFSDFFIIPEISNPILHEPLIFHSPRHKEYHTFVIINLYGFLGSKRVKFDSIAFNPIKASFAARQLKLKHLRDDESSRGHKKKCKTVFRLFSSPIVGN